MCEQIFLVNVGDGKARPGERERERERAIAMNDQGYLLKKLNHYQ